MADMFAAEGRLENGRQDRGIATTASAAVGEATSRTSITGERTDMIRKCIQAALLCGSAFAISGTALAQDPAVLAAAESQSGASGAAAVATTARAQPVDELQSKIERLQAQIDALQAALESVRAAQVKTTPSWKGAPQFEDKGAGWSFKPRGRLMYDAGVVDRPDGYSNSGLGFSNEVRRARLGVEGTVPGGFGYKFELDFAAGEVEFADAFLNYKRGDLEFTVGQHNNFQSLDELTSSLHSSFIERSAFTDAFGFERRVGASLQYAKGPLLLQTGVFTDSITDLNTVGDDNNSWSSDSRIVYAPRLGENQLHLGASFHHRDLNGAGNSVRYRQRPAIHTTDIRFIDTGNILGARSETGVGLEAAGIFGPFSTAGEAYWQKVGREGLSDPIFFGAYVEAGYFLTGETRGYKGGKFDRVKVLKPFDKGGWGSFGVNLRYDYLDLGNKGVVGGRQNALQASLNWKPTDYVLFGVNFAHLMYDAAIATDGGDRDYNVNMFGVRGQIDF
jgi:phosphate-selective porin OprO/OprP